MKDDKTHFIHVGNNLAMDFINTQIVSHGEDVDLLANMDDLFQWALDVNLSLKIPTTPEIKNSATQSLINEKVELEMVYEFRRCLKKLITAHSAEKLLPAAELETINQYLMYAPSQQKLAFTDQLLSLQPMDTQLSIQQLLGKVALEGATLLTSPQGANIKHCSNDKCVLMFVDTSRSKKRRWCSMDRCGNRAKASAFYHSNK